MFSGKSAPNSSPGRYETHRPDVLALVPREATRILDLGCSSGALAAAIKARQPANVIGIDWDPSRPDLARARLDHFVDDDLERALAREEQETMLGRFDCVIAADVLEHLRDPWAALERAAALLDPGGVAVVSLPNVRHWAVIYHVWVKRRWPRDEVGLFDRTHLHWFTLLDARTLVTSAGLNVTATSSLYRLRPGQTQLDHLASRLGPLRQWFAYQNLVVGCKPGAGLAGRNLIPGRGHDR